MVALTLGATALHGADLAGASYDAERDQIVVAIDYRGTHARHDFQLLWGPCAGGRVVARVVDTHGRDTATKPFRVHERFSLEDLPCRPATVTLRLGRVAHVTVSVPERAPRR